MKGLLISLGAVAVLATALPAAAQSWDRSYGGGGALEQRIERGIRDGSLTRREAVSLRQRLNEVQRLEWRYGRDGRISNSEARELDRRYAELERRLRFERRDDQRRGYGWNDRGYDGYRNDRGYGGGWR